MIEFRNFLTEAGCVVLLRPSRGGRDDQMAACGHLGTPGVVQAPLLRVPDKFQDRLTETAAESVKKLLPKDEEGDLEDLCSWADHVRFRFHWSGPLHYTDTPDHLCNYQYDNNTEMGKDLEIGVVQSRDNAFEQGLVVKEQKYEGDLTLENFNNAYNVVRAEPVNLTGSIANKNNVALLEMGPSKTPNGPSKIPEIRDKPISDTKESPFIDMSLKALRSTRERGISEREEHNGLRHSVMSAFSSYGQ